MFLLVYLRLIKYGELATRFGAKIKFCRSDTYNGTEDISRCIDNIVLKRRTGAKIISSYNNNNRNCRAD